MAKSCFTGWMKGNDWRLPTISELRSLIRNCPATQTSGVCGVTDSCLSRESCLNDTCKGYNTRGGPGPDGTFQPSELSSDIGWYWSSSAVMGNGKGALLVSFGDGGVHNYGVYDDDFARCGTCQR
jgi:hypothetical protein